MIVTSILGTVCLLLLVGVFWAARREHKVPDQIDQIDHNLFLLAEKEVEVLLAKEGDRSDALPLDMLNRKFKHAQENEIFWVRLEDLRATIEGHVFIDPITRIFKADYSDYIPYCKVIIHNGETMIEISDEASFDVRDSDDVTGWIKFTLVSVIS